MNSIEKSEKWYLLYIFWRLKKIIFQQNGEVLDFRDYSSGWLETLRESFFYVNLKKNIWILRLLENIFSYRHFCNQIILSKITIFLRTLDIPIKMIILK